MRSIRVLIAGIFAGVLGIQPAHADGGLTMNGWKTYCFGRFLVNVPQDAEVLDLEAQFIFGRIDTEPLPGGQMAFAKRMKDREEALRAGKHEKNYKLIEMRATRDPTSRLFVLQSEKLFNKWVNAGFEAYRTDGLRLFSMKQTAFEESKIGEVVREVETQLLPNIRARRMDEIPVEPGFCIKDGFIPDDGQTPQLEYAEINFAFKRWPDVFIRLYSRTNGDKLDEPLLERIKKPFPAWLAQAAGLIRVLRKGTRNVGPLEGQELLEKYPTEKGTYIRHFVWDSIGKTRSNTEPAFYLSVHTGEIPSLSSPDSYVQSSLTDEEAIRLFDAVVNSIRLRPTGSGGKAVRGSG